MKPLSRSFYLRPTLQVAQELLGKYFIRRIGKNLLIGKIVEVEAYRSNDPASHSFRGKTNRNSVMFCEGGHLYVYFTYGMHFCANIVTGRKGIGEAVLIRAVEPLAGIEMMKINRYGSNKSLNLKSLNRKILIKLTNGPAKFCEAFGIARQENGMDLLESKISIIEGESIPSKLIKRSSRIGIRRGVEKRWRFFIAGNPWVSK
ncbi:MAG: DNA-3-methyladenine glycosylase [Bacteroidota bacterium]